MALQGKSIIGAFGVLAATVALAGFAWVVWPTERPPEEPSEAAHSVDPTPAEVAPAPGVDGWPPSLRRSPHFSTDRRVRFAADNLEAAFRSRPHAVRRVRELSMFLYSQHEYRAARPLLRWLVEHDVEREPSLGLLGMTWIRLGRMDRAAEVFDRLVADFPESWNGHLHKGLVAFKRQELAQAEASYREAVAWAGSVGYPHHELGVALYKAGKWEEAAKELEQAARALPSHPCVHFDLMSTYRALGRTADDDREHSAYWARRKDGANLEPIELTVEFPETSAHAGPVRFSDVAAELGVDNAGRGRASAFVDFDGDGDLDILTGNLEERSRVYRSEQRGARFVEVSEALGLASFDSGYGHALADYDNDGDLDLYVTRGGFQNERPGRDANLLLRNDGGRFTDVTEAAGVGDAGAGFSGVWGDVDNDGFVDLYVANHYTANRLFRNRGDGTFEDVTDAAGVGDRRGTISALLVDFDDDGDLDLHVANNGEPNVLYRNDGGLRFTDVTVHAGVGVSGGFASVAADFDNDGRLDLFVSNMNNWHGGADFRPGDPCYLFVNRGDGTFSEVAHKAGVDYVGGPMGLGAGDWDYDGYVDLVLGNGGPEPRRWEPDIFYRNIGSRDGVPRFSNVTRAVGAWNPRMGHGLSFGDYDRDGDLDIYVPNGAHVDSDMTRNLLWRNGGHGNHFVVLRLEGTRSNRAAIGARATLYAEGLVHAKEVSGGAGFGAQDSLELEFGIGARTSIDRVDLRWPSGLSQSLPSPPIDRFLHAVEGVDGWTVRP